MILGIGTDIVDISRIEKSYQQYGDKFLHKCFHSDEIKAFQSKADISYLAKRFAAKEAFSKALGSGIGKTISWQDICIKNDDSGKPYLEITEKIQKSMYNVWPETQKIKIDLSLSDEPPYALAFVVISTEV